MTLTHLDCRRVRAETGLSQSAFARLLGVRGPTVRRFEMAPDVKSHLTPTGGTGVLYRLLLTGRVAVADLEAALSIE